MIKILVALPTGPVVPVISVLEAQAQQIDVMRFGRLYVWSPTENREDAYNQAVSSAQELGFEFILG